MTVEKLDHVHLEVQDRAAAAGWFATVLGLEEDTHFAAWAADPRGEGLT